MSLKLRDLIRQVRACKTAAEERAVIAKESAMIRTAIREEHEQYRHRNVAKLLFMHMLGYPTHFGQLECMKLIASPHFPEKRIGYLGLMLLLSEQADVLMLCTNSLKNDLNNSNRFIAGLSLCAIGNLATADMARDLAPEIDKHLTAPTPYLRKKACLAMSRCLTKVPDMVEDFVDRVPMLLKDKSHGVMITVLQLMTRMLLVGEKADEEDMYCDEDEDEDNETNPRVIVRTAFSKLVPTLVKLLRKLLSMGYSPDHDVGGISDPFLQVQILTVLRLVGENHPETSEEMNDVLAQVATNTETSKNAGNAILYEAVQTIMGIESEEGLRVLAINILGRFLLNRDNNIRYVALNTLSQSVVQMDLSAVQRHRSTIVDCLKDPDISIRQRALELIYHLVNEENVEMLTGELLNYLVICPREQRGDICTRVLQVLQTFSPDDRWRLDTLITMLTIAGRECSDEVINTAIVYISRSDEELRGYATQKLVKAIRDDDGGQRGLNVVGIWCIGEYADLILKDYTYTPSPGKNEDGTVSAEIPAPITFHASHPVEIVDTVEEVTKRHTCPPSVKQVALTCYVKLSERFSEAAGSSLGHRLKELIKAHEASHSLELQLRACEYGALMAAAAGDPFGGNAGNNTSSAAKEALARMPVVDLEVIARKQRLGATNIMGELEPIGSNGEAKKMAIAKPSAIGGGGGGDLLDLNDIFGGGDAAAPAPAQQNGTSAAPAPEKSDADLLSDIFSVLSATPAAAPASVGGYDPFGNNNGNANNNNGMFGQTAPAAADNNTAMVNDLFGGNSSPASQPQPAPTPAPAADPFGAAPTPAATPVATLPATTKISAFDKDGLNIEFECSKPDASNAQVSQVVATFQNQTTDTLVGMNMQCAVPKYITMEILPPSSTTVPPGMGPGASAHKPVRQTIRLTNTMKGSKKLMMKLKISFTVNGSKKEHMATFAGFPEGY
jgi:AP-1 complex subunit gamma-1